MTIWKKCIDKLQLSKVSVRLSRKLRRWCDTCRRIFQAEFWSLMHKVFTQGKRGNTHKFIHRPVLFQRLYSFALGEPFNASKPFSARIPLDIRKLPGFCWFIAVASFLHFPCISSHCYLFLCFLNLHFLWIWPVSRVFDLLCFSMYIIVCRHARKHAFADGRRKLAQSWWFVLFRCCFLIK